MNIFIYSMYGLASIALAVLLFVLLPGMTGLGDAGASLVAVVFLLVSMAALLLRNIVRISRRLDRLEDAHAGLFEELHRLRVRPDSGPSDTARDQDAKSREMLEEMRMLQTLLSQIVARGGLRQTNGRNDADDTPEGSSGTASTDADQDPAQLSESAFAEVMRGALSDNRVDLYLQPIVALPSRRNIHYECFSRVRDAADRIIYPADYMPVAENAGLAGTLDNILLFRCIQLIRKLGHRKPDALFFCNISSSSVNDVDFFPQFVDYMLQNRAFSDRLVFEFAHRDFISMAPDLLRQLRALGRGGYKLSLDHVETLRLEPGDLADKHVHFIKVDADLLLSGGDGDIHAADLGRQLERMDISLIASKVEDESQMPELLDMDLGFAQGFLFGEPRPSRDLPAGTMHGQSSEPDNDPT